MVNGILAMTINSAIKRDSPLKTGLRMRVEKYMTILFSNFRMTISFTRGDSPGEIPHVC